MEKKGEKEAELEKLRKQLLEKEQSLSEFKETLQRLQAEFENYKKRSEKEKSEAIRWGEFLLTQKLLPALDAFDAATQHHPLDVGLKALQKELVEPLKKAGLVEVESKGKIFNHEFHEVLMQQESDQDGMVLEELQKGYAFQGKLLRSAKVKVGKRKEGV